MKISVDKFKETCLELIDDVQKNQHEIVITKFGKPVAKLVPINNKKKSLFGILKGSVQIKGDIIGSSGVKWRANN